MADLRSCAIALVFLAASAHVERAPIGSGNDGRVLAFKLEGLERGQTRWTLEAPLSREAGADGAAVAHWPHGLTERWQRIEGGGLEQTLELEAAPPGSGDVRVHLSVKDLQLAGQRNGGLEFRDGPAGRGLRYCDAFAMMGDERRPLALQPAAGGLDIIIPEELVRDARAWPLVVDPAVVDLGPAVISPERGDDTLPKIAFAGSIGWFAAWVDHRPMQRSSIAYAVFAGSDLNPQSNYQYGRHLPPGHGDAKQVAVACKGVSSVCAVAWTDTASGGMPLVGVVIITLGGTADTVSSAAFAPLNTDSPALTWDGQKFVLAFVQRGGDAGTSSEVTVRSVTPVTGTSPPMLGLATPSGILGSPQSLSIAAAEANDALVAWQETLGPEPTLGLMHVTTSAMAALDTSMIGFGVQTPVVSASGPGYTVFWQAPYNGGYQVLAQRYPASDAGFVSAVTGPTMVANGATELSSLSAASPTALVWDGGDEVQLFFSSDGGTTGGLFTFDGGLNLNVPPYAGSGRSTTATGCMQRGPCPVIWQDSRNSDLDVYGQLASLMAPPAALISVAANTQVAPAIAASSSQLMAVWRDSRPPNDNTFAIFGAGVASQGTPLGSAFAVGNPAGVNEEPAIASDTGGFLVIWVNQRTSGSTVFGSFIDSNGAPVNPPSTPLVLVATDGGLRGPTVTFSAGGYYVVWQDAQASPVELVAWEGDAMGNPRVMAALDTGPRGGHDPRLGSSGQDTLLAWLAGTGASTDVLFGFLDSNLMLSTPFLLASDAGQTRPAVASDGTGFLVAWVDTGAAVHARTFEMNGINLSQDVVLGVSDVPARVCAAWDGLEYVVLWGEPDGGLDQADFPLPGQRVAGGGEPDVAFQDGKGGVAVFSQLDTDVLFVPRVKSLTVPINTSAGDAGSDGGSNGDGGTSMSRNPLICDAGAVALTGSPYVYDEQGRIITTDPNVTFGNCSDGGGLQVENLTGAVSWIPPDAGEYGFCVSASLNDGGGTFKCDFSVEVGTVAPPPPAAMAVVKVAGATVSADGTTSMPSKGLAYRWDFGDMSPLAFGAQQTHPYDLPGGYQVSLTVEDAYGQSDTQKFAVQISDSANHVPPIALVDAGVRSDGVTYDFGCDRCPAGTQLAWDFPDAGVLAPTASLTFVPGRFRVRLTAVDPATGLAGHDSVMIEVKDSQGTSPPQCHGTVSPRAAQVPDAGFAFFADGLFNAGGGIDQAGYAFSNASVSLVPEPTRTRDTPGVERGDLTVHASSKLVCFDRVYGVALSGGTGDAPPRFPPQAPAPATCGSAYTFTPVVEGTRPLRFSATTALPEGVMLDASTGTLSWTPALGTRGDMRLGLHVTNGAGADDTTITVSVTCVSSLDFNACGCSSSAAAPLLAVLLGLLLRKRRARP